MLQKYEYTYEETADKGIKVYVWSVALYGCETWVLNKAEQKFRDVVLEKNVASKLGRKKN
jgi:hypothetical protein